MNDPRFRDTEPTFVKLASEEPEADTPPWTPQPLAPTIIAETVDEGPKQLVRWRLRDFGRTHSLLVSFGTSGLIK